MINDLRDRVVLALPPRVIELLSQAKAAVRNKLAARTYGPVVAGIFPGSPSRELLVANDDAAVFRVKKSTGELTILKLASTSVADKLLATEAAALEELGSIEELGEWRSLIARVEGRGTHEHGTWFAQTALPGVATSAVSAAPVRVVAAVVAALRPVHEVSAQVLTANDEVLDQLLVEPLALVKQWRPDHHEAVDRLGVELRAALLRSELTLSRLHGDYAPTNVLWDSATESVSGIVDWNFHDELAVPEIDFVHYVLSLIMALDRAEYGSTVIALVDGTASSQAMSLVRQAIEAGPNALEPRVAISLTWLTHVAFGLEKAIDLRENPIWLNRNIDSVLDALGS